MGLPEELRDGWEALSCLHQRDGGECCRDYLVPIWPQGRQDRRCWWHLDPPSREFRLGLIGLAIKLIQDPYPTRATIVTAYHQNIVPLGKRFI
jgi:hypothetical protein